MILSSPKSLPSSILLCCILLLQQATTKDTGTTVRFASYNASLNRNNAGGLIADLSFGNNTQAQSIAKIIQITRPDVLLINEFDYDTEGTAEGASLAAELFQTNYLSVPQDGEETIDYPYVYAVPSNTGIPSGVDFDNDSSTSGPNDAFGFGFFPGQYAFVVFSSYPIDLDNIRTFLTFLWKDMPSALLPVNPDDETPYYSEEAIEVFRLSSKNHVDVPILIGDDTVHFLCSHPTPPVFDGPEDRNGRRNYDEIRFWTDYVNGDSYMYDDSGVSGGLE